MKNHNFNGLEIAIIGMSGRFPGAHNIEKFWQNLKNGVESISFFADEELTESGVDPQALENSNLIKASGILEGTEYFDPSFFGMTPREAEVMDPQGRMLHEYIWKALEDAGYNPDSFDGLIGLYAGASPNFNWEALSVLTDAGRAIGLWASRALVDKDFLNTRVSFNLNLRGPSFVLYSACSTSLVATHLACQALLNGECDIALAGGVTVSTRPRSGYVYEEGMIASPDGHCRAFDGRANGVIGGNGAAFVVLKRLEEALIDRDHLYAVIKGSAINNDGKRKVGYQAPSIDGQCEVIRLAQQIAEVEPESISYVEAHGTGTKLGDPIEVKALTRAFNSPKRGICGIGSVKTNVGHLDSAAGATGLIKVALSLKYKKIPASLHYESPNPELDLENSPFYVVNGLKEWRCNGYPRRAGVSSFGIGGTNAHVILEEAPELESSSEGRFFKLLLLSSRTEAALERITKSFVKALEERPDLNLADAAYTIQVGRKRFPYRKTLVCTSKDEAIKELSADDSEKLRLHFAEKNEECESVVFMFSGQGSQYVNMGRELYEQEPVFCQEMNRCFEIMEGLVDYNIKEILYPGIKGDNGRLDINQTEIAQPALFILEYALARLLIHWGIRPYAMIGHSIGEYVAACLAEVFSLEDAIKLVVARGQTMQRMSGGAMLSVPLPEAELTTLLNEELSLAAVNGPDLCVVSGPADEIDVFAKQLKGTGVNTRRLHTSHAFHSKMMDPVLEEFEREVKSVHLAKPKLPYISNLSGNWITTDDAVNPRYWRDHVRKTVRFAAGIKVLSAGSELIFIEIGPGKALSSIIRQYIDKEKGHKIVNTIRHPKEDESDVGYLLDSIGRLWLFGKNVDWDTFYEQEKRHRVALPTYPFERQVYTAEGDPFRFIGQRVTPETLPLTKKKDMADWFYIPSWKRADLAVNSYDKTLDSWNHLVFIDDHGIGVELIKQLEQRDQNVAIVKIGEGFAREGDKGFRVNPQNRDDYELMFGELQKAKMIPQTIVHLWSLNGRLSKGSDLKAVKGAQDLGFYSLLYIAQAIGTLGITDNIQMKVITDGIHEVTGDESIFPANSTVLGPVKTIPHEYYNLNCQSIDILLPDSGDSDDRTFLMRQLVTELSAESSDKVIAYRNKHRWNKIFEPIRMEKPLDLKPGLREEGVYLITGGLGGIGMGLAEYLVSLVKARLILVGRSRFPDPDEWQAWLQNHDEMEQTSLKIRKLQDFEKLGSEILILQADVADEKQMNEAVIKAKERFGNINGVIHSAGIVDAGIIQYRNREMVDRVFASKIDGTMILDSIFREDELDFFVFCSSLGSILETGGQVAYTAVNTFLDTFAHYKMMNGKAFTVSINWDAWREAGMAVEAARSVQPGSGQSNIQFKEVAHPIFDRCIVSGPDEETYISKFSAQKYWLLREHIVNETMTLSGTAYIEMAKAAFEPHAATGVIEIQDVYFFSLLTVEEDEEKEIYTVLTKVNNVYDFVIKSRVGEGSGGWQTHASGKIFSGAPKPPRKFDIAEIEKRCSDGEKILTQKDYDESGHGPRWSCLKRAKFGPNQQLSILELPEPFVDDLNDYHLNPALFDNALIFYNIKYKYSYVPFWYKKVTVYGGLSKKMYSYIRFIEDKDSQETTAKFNLTIMDESGIEILNIRELLMMKIDFDGGKDFSLAEQDSPKARIPQKEAVEQTAESRGIALEEGLLTLEGMEAFNRILAFSFPQVAVSTRDLNRLIEIATGRQEGEVDSAKSQDMKQSSEKKHHRPQLSSPYVAPKTETEKLLAQMWQELFGIEEVGINDDFFELGGTSLMGIQVVNRLREYGIDITIDQLYLHSTIKKIGEAMRHEGDFQEDISVIADYVSENYEGALYYKVYNIDDFSARVLYIMDEKMYIEDVLENLTGKFGNTSCPNFLKLIKSPDEIIGVENVDQESFVDAIGLKREVTNEEREKILMELEKNSTLTSQLRENAVSKVYGISPVQRTFLSQPHEEISKNLALVTYEFNYPIDFRKMKILVLRLVNENSLLRSFIENSNGSYSIKEFDSFLNFDLAIIDISEYAFKCKEEILNEIHIKMHEPMPVINNLLFRVCLVKCDNSIHQLIIVINHLIVDGETIGILQNKVMDISKRIEEVIENPEEIKNYADYVDFLDRQNYKDIGLEKYFSFKYYQESLGHILAGFRMADVKEDNFYIDISNMNKNLTEFYNEIIFLCYAKVVKELFTIDKVPLAFVSNGRIYKDGNFKNIIGDFHDQIPVLFRFDQGLEPNVLIRRFLDYKDLIREKNLNFSNYILKEKISVQNINSLTPFFFNSMIGLPDFLEGRQGDDIRREKVKESVSGPTFQLTMLQSIHQNKIWVSFLQNSTFEESKIKELFLNIYSETVNSLNNCKEI